MKKIPKFNLILEKTEESKNEKFGYEDYEDYVGRDFQIGGNPKWIQENETPICLECREKMTFYAQLDSVNDNYKIGDCGLIYVFVCFECLTTKSILQTY